jgi:hypothetical protein
MAQHGFVMTGSELDEWLLDQLRVHQSCHVKGRTERGVVQRQQNNKDELDLEPEDHDISLP